MVRKKKTRKRRSIVALQMILRTGNHTGAHKNRTADIRKGRCRKVKHKRGAGESGPSSFLGGTLWIPIVQSRYL